MVANKIGQKWGCQKIIPVAFMLTIQVKSIWYMSAITSWKWLFSKAGEFSTFYGGSKGRET